MERSTEHITGILLSRDIPCLYDRDENLVYSCCESEYGNTHSVYGCSSNVIRNIAIYDQILRSDIKDIRVCLEKLNRKINNGYFLTNPRIEYIIFCSEYAFSDKDLQIPTLNFITFCLHSHEVFTRYRTMFYNLINDTNKKIRS